MAKVSVDEYNMEKNAQSESPSGIVPVGANVLWHGEYVLLERSADSASGGYADAETQGVAAFKADGYEVPKKSQLVERNLAEPNEVDEELPDMWGDLDDVHFVSAFEPEAVESE